MQGKKGLDHNHSQRMIDNYANTDVGKKNNVTPTRENDDIKRKNISKQYK